MKVKTIIGFYWIPETRRHKRLIRLIETALIKVL